MNVKSCAFYEQGGRDVNSLKNFIDMMLKPEEDEKPVEKEPVPDDLDKEQKEKPAVSINFHFLFV